MDAREKIRQEIVALYRKEHAELGEKGTMELLEKGRQWDLSGTLSAGGIVVFPHAGVADCGHQIAAAVHGCLDSGADKVLVVSVLHAFTQEMEDARIRVANGADVTKESTWGVQGEGLGRGDNWKRDHVLISWHHLWEAEIKRRGIKGPKMITRFPYLAGGKPEILPGIEELQEIAKDAVIVSTADPFHHGIGYGTPREESYDYDEEGIAVARASINEGIEILGRGDYWGYNQQCVRAKSDARDAGQVFRYLRGPMTGEILDIAITDSADVYNAEPPTWVAGALIEWRLANG
ncbi:MAG: hypothetical protein AAF614_00145 [Chloroflexota bacterium]